MGLSSGTRRRELSSGRWPSARRGTAANPFQGLASGGIDVEGSGRTLLTVSEDASLWDLAVGRPVRTFRNSILGVRTGALSSDGRMVACGGTETRDSQPVSVLNVWESSTGKKLRTIGIDNIFDALTAFADGNQSLVAYTGRGGTLACFDIASGRMARVLTGHQGQVRQLRVSRGGLRAVTSAEDGKVVVWDLGSGAALRTFTAGASVGIDGPGRRVASIVDKRAVVWDVDSGQEVLSVAPRFGYPPVVALSSDGRRLLTSGDHGSVSLWAVESGQELRTFRGHTSPANSVAWSPDGRTAAAGYGSGTTALWSLEEGVLSRANDDSSSVSAVAFSPDGRGVLSGLDDGTALLRDPATGRILCALEGRGKGGVAFAPDGRSYICGGGRIASIFEAANGAKGLSLVHELPIREVRFSPDGTRVLTWSGRYDQDQKLLVWDARTGKLLVELGGHGGLIQRIELSADGSKVVAAAESPGQTGSGGARTGEVRVWDVVSGRELAVYVRPGRRSSCLT